MSIIIKALKQNKKSIAQFGRDIGCSRIAAHRIAHGSRFISIRALFSKIYDATKLTPNDILGIPPRKDGGK
jgi:hypothetical protein